MLLKQTGQLAPSTEPWQLIRDAVADLELQERTPGIVIHMDYWHQPSQHVCYQCLAGATISRRLGVDTEDFRVPHNFPRGVKSRLKALSLFCYGNVRDACDVLGLPTAGLDSRYVNPYKSDPDRFKTTMRNLADYLEAHYKDSAGCPICHDGDCQTKSLDCGR